MPVPSRSERLDSAARAGGGFFEAAGTDGRRLVPLRLDTPLRRPVGAVHVWLAPQTRARPRGRMASLSWDLLAREGTAAQRDAWNALRLRYVARLYAFLRRACRAGRLCSPAGVGTTGDLTPASDVDINLHFDADSVRQHLRSIDALYDSLRRFHRRSFAASHQTAEALFDINVYGSDLRLPADAHGCSGSSSGRGKDRVRGACIQLLTASPQQRLWALLRLAELPRDGRDDWIPRLLRLEGRPDLARDVRRARALMHTLPAVNLRLSRRRRRYLSTLRAFFRRAIESDVPAAADAFSRSKVYEHETYRSAGAYLHVVGGRKDLSPQLYRDSAADNLGFALGSLLLAHDDVPFQARMLRVAKYIERATDALLLAEQAGGPLPKAEQAADAAGLSLLRSLMRVSAEINVLRKSLAVTEGKGKGNAMHRSRARRVRELLRLLGVDQAASADGGAPLRATRDAIVRCLVARC